MQDNKLDSIFRARVEANNDPLKIGRLRVRVPFLHGNPDGSSSYISNYDLPWAMPCLPPGAGFDQGTFIVPEVGTTVFVFFENTSAEYPVYIGSSYGTNSTYPHMLGQEDVNAKVFTASNGLYRTTVGENEVPKEISGESDEQSTKKIIYKSPKGASIIIDEADEGESILIVDRLGQVLRMDSPVSVADNKFNKARRGSGTVDKGGLSQFVRGTGKITIINAQKDSIILDGATGIHMSTQQGAIKVDMIESEVAIKFKDVANVVVNDDYITMNHDESSFKLDNDLTINVKGKVYSNRDIFVENNDYTDEVIE